MPGHVGKEALRVGVVLHEASEQGPELPQHKPFLTLHSRVELEDRSAQVLDRHDSHARIQTRMVSRLSGRFAWGAPSGSSGAWRGVAWRLGPGVIGRLRGGSDRGSQEGHRLGC